MHEIGTMLADHLRFQSDLVQLLVLLPLMQWKKTDPISR
jgi:hypothetical protein